MNPMRLDYALVAALWAGGLVAVACGGGGYTVGQSCDPRNGDRDCASGLSCAYSYDDCPQYGCPKCRRPCRADADCPVDEVKSCGKTPHCTFGTRTDFQGLCDACDEQPHPLPGL